LSPVDIIPPWFYTFTWGIKNRPVGGSSSDTQSHPIDMMMMMMMIIIIIIRWNQAPAAEK
jgi:hypothetical protein